MAWELCACQPPVKLCPERSAQLLCVTDSLENGGLSIPSVLGRTFTLRGKRCGLVPHLPQTPRACPRVSALEN